MNSIMRYTKEVYNMFIEVNGQLKVNSSSVLGKMKLGDKITSFLSDYIDFVMNSGVLSEVTKIYIKSIENSPRDAIRTYNQYESKGAKFTPKQASNYIYYDTQTLLKLFPEDMLSNVIFRKVDVEIYRPILNNAINKKLGRTPFKKLSVLRLSAVANNNRPSEEEIDQFFMLYAPYTKERIKQVEEQIPKSVVGYINYLMEKRDLSTEEQQIIDRLNNINVEVKDTEEYDDLDIE